MINMIILFLGLIIVSTSSNAGSTQSSSEKLMWNGKVVSPFCFDRMDPMGKERAPRSVDITKCTGKEKIEISKRGNGREWVMADYPEGGYSAYDVIGKIGTSFVIFTIWNGGGSGHFSDVVIVSLHQNKMKILNRFGGGDRCNGGISDVSVMNGQVYITSNITPSDFPRIFYGDDYKSISSKGLESRAGSCFATVTTSSDKIVKINLDVEATNDRHDASTNLKYQHCFNDVFEKQAHQKSELTLDEFRAFMGRFFHVCIREKSGE